MAALNFGFANQRSSGSTSRSRTLVKSITKKIESLINSKESHYGELQILVTEIQCFEPDCVPLETLIILLGDNTRWSTKILKPLAEVTDEDINLLDIPDILPVVQTELSKKKKAEGEEVPAHPQWVLGIMNIIDQHDEPQYSSELEYLRDYLQQKLNNSSSLKTESSSVSSNNSNPPPTVVKMKSNASSNSSSITHNMPPTLTQPSNQASKTNSSTSLPTAGPPPSLPTPLPPTQPLILTSKQDDNPKPRHQKGVRQRGCPCCDPDNLDNIVDRLLYFDAPP